MQIRERKEGRVECLRAVWDPVAKRTRQRIIKPEDFTDAERAQFDAWQAEQKAQHETKMAKVSANTGHWWIERLTDAIEAGHVPDQPEKLLAALDRLNKVLRKAGVKRPPRAAKQHKDTKTADLLSN